LVKENDKQKQYYVKVDDKGEVLWEKTFGDKVVGLPSLAVQGDSFLLLGSTETANKGQDMLLISINGTGSTNWSKTYGSKKDETASQIGILSKNSYLLAGLVKENDKQKQYYVKVDDKGDVELENTYYTAGIGELKTQLLPVLEGTGFIGVSNFKNEENFQQPLIMRINDKAEVLWSIASLTPNTNADIIVKDIELGVNKNGYVVTGYNTTRPYGWIATFDYTGVHCASLGCDSINVVTAIKDINKKATIEVNPNPIHSNINISYDFPETVEVNPSFQLYSLKGEEVVNVQLDVSKKSTQVDTSELPSGIYFYKATYRGINLGIGKLAIK
ncbi:MAG: T9SS type A sorting domain-containing protein, partial [Chitinophagales bacterium]